MDEVNVQEKIYDAVQDLQSKSTEQGEQLKQIESHLAELNSQTKKNTNNVEELKYESHSPGECEVVGGLKEKMGKIDNFIEHWPKLQKIIYILLGLLFLQIPWVSNYLEQIFKSLGVMRYFF